MLKKKNSQSERDLQSWWQFQDSDSRCNWYVPAVAVMKAHKDRTLQCLYSSQNHPTTPSWIPSWGMIMIICGCIIRVCGLGVLGEPISFRRALGQGSGTWWDGGGGGGLSLQWQRLLPGPSGLPWVWPSAVPGYFSPVACCPHDLPKLRLCPLRHSSVLYDTLHLSVGLGTVWEHGRYLILQISWKVFHGESIHGWSSFLRRAW